MKKLAILIDGGHLRAEAKSAKITFDVDLIDSFACACVHEDEELFRIFYYDAPHYRGKVKLPVSGKSTDFKSSDKWLRQLAGNT